MPRVSLRPYQNDAADFLYERDRGMILAPVGAGKTAITLTAMAAMVADGHVRRWLVLAPKRVCTDVWPVEGPKWAPGLSIAVAVGTPRQREAAFASDAAVVVTNYDNLQALTNLDGFDGVVFDELTRLKNPSGKRFKALEAKIERFRVRWGLTGSFTSNGLEDVFGQCKVVDQKLLGRSKGAFLQKYFVCLNREYGEWMPRKGALGAVMDAIRPATFVLEPGEYKDKLPPLHTVEMRCDLADRAPYEKMKKDFLVELKGQQITALSAAAVTGKLQQMACVAEGTPVLTDRGWAPIQEVALNDLVWDGENWVAHEGPVFQGNKPVAFCHGVAMTYDHMVLTVSGWQTCGDILYGDESGRFAREDVRLPDSVAPRSGDETRPSYVAVPLRMRGRGSPFEPVSTRPQTSTSKELRVSSWQHSAWNDRHPSFSDMGQHESSLSQPQRQRLQKLWRAGRYNLRRMGGVLRCVLAGYAEWLRGSFIVGAQEQRRTVFAGKLPVGNAARTAQQQAVERMDRRARRPCNHSSSGESARNASANAFGAIAPVQLVFGKGTQYARTYDILNCGPRNRLVVRSVDGRPLIVHNCGFAYNSQTVAQETAGKFTVKQDAVWFSPHKFDLLDDILAENQRDNTIVAYAYKEELAELKRRYPNAATLDDHDAINRWNAGKIELLLVHPKSAGHGLNLQHGGNKMVFLSLPWSLELFEQTVGRLHRGGQTKPVWVYVLLCNKTIDERIWAALYDKRAVSDIALDELKGTTT